MANRKTTTQRTVPDGRTLSPHPIPRTFYSVPLSKRAAGSEYLGRKKERELSLILY